MKKTGIITAALGLCLTAVLFAGCDNGGGSTGETVAVQRLEGGQTQITVETSANTADTEGEYGFSYNGYKIMPGTETKEAVSILGDDYDIFENATCAGQGVDVAYMYFDGKVTIGAYRDIDNVERINVIQITDSIVDCGGMRVGDTVASVKAVLGTPDAEDAYSLSYKASKTQLQIITDGVDKVSQIVYRTLE